MVCKPNLENLYFWCYGLITGYSTILNFHFAGVIWRKNRQNCIFQFLAYPLDCACGLVSLRLHADVVHRLVTRTLFHIPDWSPTAYETWIFFVQAARAVKQFPAMISCSNFIKEVTVRRASTRMLDIQNHRDQKCVFPGTPIWIAQITWGPNTGPNHHNGESKRRPSCRLDPKFGGLWSKVWWPWNPLNDLNPSQGGDFQQETLERTRPCLFQLRATLNYKALGRGHGRQQLPFLLMEVRVNSFLDLLRI